jgi:hypothetical protein
LSNKRLLIGEVMMFLERASSFKNQKSIAHQSSIQGAAANFSVHDQARTTPILPFPTFTLASASGHASMAAP